MMNDSAAVYYAKRAKRERELAATAVIPAARKIHLALARRYAVIEQDTEAVATILSLVK